MANVSVWERLLELFDLPVIAVMLMAAAGSLFLDYRPLAARGVTRPARLALGAAIFYLAAAATLFALTLLH